MISRVFVFALVLAVAVMVLSSISQAVATSSSLLNCDNFHSYGQCQTHHMRCKWIPGQGCVTKNERTLAPNHKPTPKTYAPNKISPNGRG